MDEVHLNRLLRELTKMFVKVNKLLDIVIEQEQKDLKR